MITLEDIKVGDLFGLTGHNKLPYCLYTFKVTAVAPDEITCVWVNEPKWAEGEEPSNPSSEGHTKTWLEWLNAYYQRIVNIEGFEI